MCCKNLWKRIIPFTIALAIGLVTANILYKQNLESKTLKPSRLGDKVFVVGDGDDDGSGVIGCYPNGFNEKRESVTSFIEGNPKNYLQMAGEYPLEIISEIRAKYTETANRKGTQGKVVLRVTFLDNGKIGKILVVKDLPNGLTKEAISAAKQIKFTPASSHGTFYSQTKTVTYTFSLN